MFSEFRFEREFFEQLRAVDAELTAIIAAGGCRGCGGRLHRSDYRRKPRGGFAGALGEAFAVRFSLCCDREGCRRRATPPSLRFLGRRVYLGATVIAASVVAHVVLRASAAARATAVPATTLRRWRTWWSGPFTWTPVFAAIAARLVPAPAKSALPLSVLERFEGTMPIRSRGLLIELAPLTTATASDDARLLRGLVSSSSW